MRQFIASIALMIVALPAWAATEVTEVTSPGGIKAWLVQEHSIPFVALELRFRGGGSLDQPGKRGATNLMVGLLEEGAGALDSQGFARAREALAAEFGYDVSADALSISARFLTENRDEAVTLLRDSLIMPTFDAASIERVRGQVTAGLLSNAKDPNDIVRLRYNEMAFGAHPYGSSLSGTLESVAALTREDIVAAHQGAMARDRIYVGAVGDISAEDLGLLLDQLLGDLPETGAALPAKVAYGLAGGVTVVDFDTPQSVVRFGHGGIKRDDEDFFAAYVLNVVLGGGGFESRLMTEVREKRGLTYGVYSSLVPRDLSEMYLGSVASANDRVAEAIEVIRDEWTKMAEHGVTQEEMARAKTYLTGAYPLRFDGNGTIANIMVGMQMDDLPVDYIATRNSKVEAVTLDDVNRVAKRILRPQDLHFVVVGKPVGLTSE